MMKPRKITVKHYLNKNLKPDLIDGLQYYSIYVLIIVNRTNTKTKSIISEKFSSIESANNRYGIELENELKNIENQIGKKLLLDSSYCLNVPKPEMIKRKKSIIRTLQKQLKKNQSELLELQQYNLFKAKN